MNLFSFHVIFSARIRPGREGRGSALDNGQSERNAHNITYGYYMLFRDACPLSRADPNYTPRCFCHRLFPLKLTIACGNQ